MLSCEVGCFSATGIETSAGTLEGGLVVAVCGYGRFSATGIETSAWTSEGGAVVAVCGYMGWLGRSRSAPTVSRGMIVPKESERGWISRGGPVQMKDL